MLALEFYRELVASMCMTYCMVRLADWLIWRKARTAERLLEQQTAKLLEIRLKYHAILETLLKRKADLALEEIEAGRRNDFIEADRCRRAINDIERRMDMEYENCLQEVSACMKEFQRASGRG